MKAKRTRKTLADAEHEVWDKIRKEVAHLDKHWTVTDTKWRQIREFVITGARRAARLRIKDGKAA